MWGINKFQHEKNELKNENVAKRPTPSCQAASCDLEPSSLCTNMLTSQRQLNKPFQQPHHIPSLSKGNDSFSFHSTLFQPKTFEKSH